MEVRNLKSYIGLGDKLLIFFNFCFEEVEWILLMFVVYIFIFIGLIWLELSIVSLFLD